MMQQRTPPASPLSDATNKVNASPATPTTALSKTPTALSVRSQTNAKNLMHPRPTQPAYQTPMAKLTHPSPEPTITSLRMLNVVLQKRLTREEDSRNQRTQAFDLCTTYMQPLPTVQALVARNEQQQQRLIEVIRAKQDQLRLSLEQQCDLTSTVRSLQDSQRQHMVVQADQDREIHKLKAQLADFQQQDRTLRQRLEELEQGSLSTQAHVQQVATTIAAIKQQGRSAQQADDAVEELQARVQEARKRQRVVSTSTPEGKESPAVDRQGIKALLAELQSATRMQHKAHAKIKQLEAAADRLRAEVTSREDALLHMRAELQQAREAAARLQAAQGSGGDEVAAVRQQHEALTQRCQEADAQLQKIMAQVAHAQALLERGDSTVALQEQLHDAVAAREAAEARAQALQEELSSATARLEEAVARGTPRGEGAKVVLRKSFVRIRELQSRLAEAHAAVAEATALREGLAGAQERLEELQARFADELSSVGTAPTADASAAAVQAQLVESMRREQEHAALAAAYKQQVQQLAASREELQLRMLALEETVDEGTAAREAATALQAAAEAAQQELEQQAMHAEQLRCLLDAARREGTPKGEGAKRVLGMAFEKIRDLQGRLDLLTAEHASLQQRQQAHAARVEDANCLAAALLQALGGQEEEAGALEDPSWRLPARLRAALMAAQAPPSTHEELRQLRDELQATIREKASIAAENAALRTEIRSLETRAALLTEQAESTAERAAVLEQRAQRARGAEEQTAALRQQVEGLQRRLAAQTPSPSPAARQETTRELGPLVQMQAELVLGVDQLLTMGWWFGR